MGDAPATASTPFPPNKEYTLFLAGAEELMKERFIATFPLGPPGFTERRGRATWDIVQEEAQFVAPQRGVSLARRTAAPLEWVLTEQPGGAQHRGSAEASMSRQALPATNAAGALQPGGGGGRGGGNHFLLVKHGAEFAVRPVEGWYTFRPLNTRRGQHTLEQAEAQMSSRSSARPLRAPPRLQQLAIADPVDENAMAGGKKGSDSENDGGVSDTEDRDSIARIARKSKGGRGGPAAPSMEAVEAEAGRDAGGSGSPSTRTGRGGGGTEGDWEFEDDRADDDLDMDPDEDAPHDDAKDLKKQKDAMSDEEAPQISDGSSGGGDESDALSPGAAMEKLLARERAEDGGDGGGSNGDGGLSDESDDLEPLAGYADDDFDDEDDEAMLEKMDRADASAAQRNAPADQKDVKQKSKSKSKSRSKTPEVAPPKPSKSAGTTAPVEAAAATGGGRAKQKRKATPAGEAKTGKKAKKAAAEKPSAAAAAESAGKSAAASMQPPTQSELVEWLRAAGPVPVEDFTKYFKRRLRSDADKQAFAKMFKTIATRKEIQPGSGVKLVVLR